MENMTEVDIVGEKKINGCKLVLNYLRCVSIQFLNNFWVSEENLEFMNLKTPKLDRGQSGYFWSSGKALKVPPGSGSGGVPM